MSRYEKGGGELRGKEKKEGRRKVFKKERNMLYYVHATLPRMTVNSKPVLIREREEDTRLFNLQR